MVYHVHKNDNRDVEKESGEYAWNGTSLGFNFVQNQKAQFASAEHLEIGYDFHIVLFLDDLYTNRKKNYQNAYVWTNIQTNVHYLTFSFEKLSQPKRIVIIKVR